MPMNAFIVRPFGIKEVEITTPGLAETLVARHQSKTLAPLVTAVERVGESAVWKAKIDFDDEAIGRKTLVVAQANLERDID